MEDKFITEDNSRESPILKYGKKSKHKSKSHSFLTLLTTIIILSFSILFIYLLFSSKTNNNFVIDKKSLETQFNGNSSLDKLQEIALNLPLHPYPTQQFFINKTNTALLNAFIFIRFEKTNTNLTKIKETIIKVIKNHPVIFSKFSLNKNGDIFIKYDKNTEINIETINIKDEDIPKLGDNLLTVFKPFDSPLFKIKIYISETYICLFLDFFHTIMDGNSLIILYESFELAFNNKPLPKDYYFLYLKEYNDNYNSEISNKTKKYYLDNYVLNKHHYPKFDEDIPDEIKKNKKPVLYSAENDSELLKQQLVKYFGERDRNYEIFMCMNVLITNYIYSNFTDESPEMRMGNNGRNFRKERYSVGCLITDIPIKYNFKNKKININNFKNEIKSQIEMGRKLNRFPYIHIEPFGGGIRSILQRRNSFVIDKFFGKPSDNYYNYDNLLNMNTEYLFAPIVMELEISKNSANFVAIFDGKYYKKSSFERYWNILIKSSGFLMDNMENNNDIDIEKYFNL